jgi:hypothetical protein
MDSKSEKQRALLALEREGLLDGFLDGELDDAQSKRVVAVLDPILHRAAVAELELLRTSLKSFVSHQSAERVTQWSAWQAIEAELVPFGQNSLAARAARFKAAAAEAFEFLLRPQVAGAVFACSAALVAVSVWNRSSAIDPMATTPVVTLASEQLTPIAPDLDSVVAVNESRPQSRDRRGFDFAMGGGESSASVAFVGNPRLRDNHTLLAQSYNPHGLRIGSTDIDWIKAGTHIDIVPAANEDRPPVIWVGQKIR